MMEHMQNFDWSTERTDEYFVREEDIDDCVIERIINDRFIDPLLEYDKKDDKPNPPIDWSDVFGNKSDDDDLFRTPVSFTKLSSLTGKEHYIYLKVLCSQNPHLLPGFYTGKPTATDHRIFQKVKRKYESKQIDYLAWAFHTLWSTDEDIQTLQPKPTIEMVYGAKYIMRWGTEQSVPKKYSLAALIPLLSRGRFDFVFKENVIHVTTSKVPKKGYPKNKKRKYPVLKRSSMPEPCGSTLPNDSSVSSDEYDAKRVLREAALKPLPEDTDSSWIQSEDSDDSDYQTLKDIQLKMKKEAKAKKGKKLKMKKETETKKGRKLKAKKDTKIKKYKKSKAKKIIPRRMTY